MAQTKGVGFGNVRSFVVERFGKEAWEPIVAELPPHDGEILASVIGVGWYDLALYTRLIRTVDRMRGRGDLDLVRELGRYEAEKDLTTINRMFLRLANPAFAIEKMGEYWRRFHDTGTWALKRESETHVTGTLDGWGVVDEALCAEVTTYMERVLQLVGATDAKIEHPRCRARGAATCGFVLRWGRKG